MKTVLRRRDLLPELRRNVVTITVRRPFGVLSWRLKFAWWLMRLGAWLAAAGARITGVRVEHKVEQRP